MRIFTSEVDLEVIMKDGRIVAGKATGRVIPAEPAFKTEVADLALDLRVYANDDDAVGTPATMDDLADEWDQLEQLAVDSLCGEAA